MRTSRFGQGFFENSPCGSVHAADRDSRHHPACPSSRRAGPSAPGELLYRYGAMYSNALARHEYWRLVAYGFLHFDFVHLTMNMLCLVLWGAHLEKRIGSLYFLIVYFSAMILGAVIGDLAFAGPYLTVGASGATSGILGALLCLWILGKAGLDVNFFAVNIGLNLAFAVANPKVNWRIHLGGFVMGLVACAVLDLIEKMNARLLRCKFPEFVKINLAILACAAAILLFGNRLSAAAGSGNANYGDRLCRRVLSCHQACRYRAVDEKGACRHRRCAGAGKWRVYRARRHGVRGTTPLQIAPRAGWADLHRSRVLSTPPVRNPWPRDRACRAGRGCADVPDLRQGVPSRHGRRRICRRSAARRAQSPSGNSTAGPSTADRAVPLSVVASRRTSLSRHGAGRVSSILRRPRRIWPSAWPAAPWPLLSAARCRCAPSPRGPSSAVPVCCRATSGRPARRPSRPRFPQVSWPCPPRHIWQDLFGPQQVQPITPITAMAPRILPTARMRLLPEIGPSLSTARARA